VGRDGEGYAGDLASGSRKNSENPKLNVVPLEFEEDAAREEVIFPLVVRLGYASSSDSQIIRPRNQGFTA
jgi:hypothetical protein